MSSQSGFSGIWCPACDRAQTPSRLVRQMASKQEGMLMQCQSCKRTFSYSALMAMSPKPRMDKVEFVEKQPAGTQSVPLWLHPEVISALQQKFPSNLLTTLHSAVTALADAGLAPSDPVLRSAARFLLAEEISVKGDWSVRRPELEPAGWAFEFANDNYPDIDDTAEVVIALGRTDESATGAVDRAIAWIEGMQCHDGGWGAFDVDNTQTLCRDLPFCDFGELIDPPSADVTAHVVEMLAKLGGSKDVVELGVRWLLRAQ